MTGNTPIFILGCERSGSTWLTNIFESHPDILLYMEPFKHKLTLFKHFPDRNIYLSQVSQAFATQIQTDYGALYRHKFGLFYRPQRSLYWKLIDDGLFNFYQWSSRKKFMRMPLKIRRHHNLNLNTNEIDTLRQLRKADLFSVEVVKELRLNFKVGLLAQVFPDSRYVVIIRHPCAQINSIKRLFEQGLLDELRNSLVTFISTLLETARFAAFHPVVEALDWENDLDTTLLLWWVINYSTLIEDLKHFDRQFKLVYHETLSSSPLPQVESIFRFCDLTVNSQVIDYLTTSSSTQKTSQAALNPVDTNRNSAEYYRQQLAKIPTELTAKTIALFEALKAHNLLIEELLPYWQMLTEKYENL